MPSGLTFDLSIDPDPRFVSSVRRFVEEAFERLLPDPDAAFRVSLTAHELLDNAVKHGSAGRALLRFSARLGGEHALVNLSLINETTLFHIERLRTWLAAIGSAQNPVDHYQKLLGEYQSRTGPRRGYDRDQGRGSGDPGLGLARIAAEAQMMLGLEVKESTVAILASSRAPTPPDPERTP